MKNTKEYASDPEVEYTISEEWKPIAGFPNYAVSNKGRVKNIETDKIQNISNVNCDNYYYVRIINTKNKKKINYIHHLVADAFIPNPKKYRFIEHINGDIRDNRVENLKWVKVDKAITPHCELWIKKTIKELRRKMTIPEQKFYNECIDAGISLKYQQAEYVNGNIYFIDFKVSNLNIAIEIDGKYHNDAEQANKDKIRTKNLNKLKYNVFRITNAEACNKTSVEYFITQLKNLIRRKPSTLKAKYRIRVVPDSEY